MNTSDKYQVAFVDGVALDVEEYSIYLGTAFSDMDVNASRMLLLVGKQKWISHDIPSKIVSVAASLAPLEFYALGRDGFVSIATPTELKEESITDAGTGKGRFGYVSFIKRIHDEIYVCGHRYQFYRRDNGRWVHMDKDLLYTEPRAIGRNLNSFDGTSPDNIYTVGDRGEILHYDGTRWKETESPTNMSLERVMCIDQNEVFICGAKGTFLRGKKGLWENLSREDLKENFWGMCEYKDRVFLSTASGIFEWDGHDLFEVDLSFEFEGGFNRLTSSDRLLWAVGINDIACYDGENWEIIVYPDNIR